MHLPRICFTLVALSPISLYAATFNDQLGTAGTFAILAGSTITSTGPTVIHGDVGLHPGTSIVVPGAVILGSIYAADAVTLQAQNDLTSTYNSAVAADCNSDLTGQDLGGLTLFAGVYCFSSTAGLTGTLTLDAQGQADAIFLFQIGSTLTTASNSSIAFINDAHGGNLYWQVGSSATLGTNTAFAGTIMAQESITLNTGASITCGRALARTAAVTMDSNFVSAEPEACSPSNVPEPSSALLLLVATPGLYWLRRRKR